MKKWVIGVIAFAVFLGGCFFLYQKLSGEYRPQDQLVTVGGGETGASETGESTADSGPAASSESQPPAQTEESTAQTQQSASSANETSAAGTSSGEADNNDSMAMDFKLADADGNEYTFYDLLKAAGKPMVVNFWASWCGPCKSEMPEFQKLYEEKGDSIGFLMVNLTDGSRETVEKATKFIEEQGYSFPVYYDIWQEAAYTYYINSIPMTIFVRADGTLEAYAEGALDEELLQKGIGMLEDSMEQ